MLLSEVVKNYRRENRVSMEELAKRAGLSKGYVSMLENGVNPRSKKPISPTLDSLMKLSRAMMIDLDTLLRMVDGDQSVSLICDDTSTPSLSTDEESLLTSYRQLNRIGKSKAREYVSDLAENAKYIKDTESLTG